MSTQDAAVCRGIPHFTSTTRKKETKGKEKPGDALNSHLGDVSHLQGWVMRADIWMCGLVVFRVSWQTLSAESQ